MAKKEELPAPDRYNLHPESEILAAYIDGHLQPVESDAVSKHIETCKRCQALIKAQESARPLNED